MTNSQAIYVEKAMRKVREARESLDIAMYRTGGLSDEEYQKVSGCYERLCKAQDYITNGASKGQTLKDIIERIFLEGYNSLPGGFEDWYNEGGRAEYLDMIISEAVNG